MAQKEGALKAERDAATNERKELWREKSALTKKISSCEEEINRQNNQLSSSMPRDLRNGLDNCLLLVEKHKIKGVHGPLCELFTCDKAFSTAVEITAGNKLFNVVVDTDQTAAKVLELLHKVPNSGRVTFMPLNRLNSTQPKYPESQDAFPMVQRLKYDPTLEKAMLQVFGKTLICRNLESGRKFSKQYRLDAVTLDGDQCSTKGTFTGGSIEWKQARVDIVRSRREKQAELKDAESELAQMGDRESQVEQRITKLNSQVRNLEQSRHSARSEHEDARQEMKNTGAEIVRLRADLVNKNRLLEKTKKERSDAETGVGHLTDELNSDFSTKLSSSEQKELKRLNTELPQMKEMLVKLGSARSSAESQKDEIEETLTGNLVKQQEELENTLQTLEANDVDKGGDLAQLKDDYDAAVSDVEALTAQQKEIDKEIETLRKELQSHQKQAEAHRTTEAGCEKFVDSEGKRLSKLITSRQALQTKAEEAAKKIAGLGLLPDGYAKYTGKSSKELMKLLQKCNEKLKKFSHVNKKALDQHVQFTEQCEILRERKHELDEGSQAIQQLITQLDNKKNEAILRTFKGVSKHFSKVFEELVPVGNGNLVMRRKKDQDAEAGGDSNKNDVQQFSGVGIKVSFTGQGEHMMMKQLSGGQKSLVALALVFAIQRCDPAPFYLFDEIDAALDPVARTAVANMIRRQSSATSDTPTQFITTTFRPELVNAADKHYQISFSNKVSRINSVDKKTAMKSIAPR